MPIVQASKQDKSLVYIELPNESTKAVLLTLHEEPKSFQQIVASAGYSESMVRSALKYLTHHNHLTRDDMVYEVAGGQVGVARWKTIYRTIKDIKTIK
jgi:predicted transcriptional regulator